MTTSQDLATVQRWYAALANGDQPEIDAVASPDLVWDITPSVPGGGVYTGRKAIFEDFFPQSAAGFAALGVRADDFLADGAGRVAVRGVYLITAKDGETAEARFAHFWTVADGRLVRMEHVGESSVFQRLRQD